MSLNTGLSTRTQFFFSCVGATKPSVCRIRILQMAHPFVHSNNEQEMSNSNSIRGDRKNLFRAAYIHCHVLVEIIRRNVCSRMLRRFL